MSLLTPNIFQATMPLKEKVTESLYNIIAVKRWIKDAHREMYWNKQISKMFDSL